MRTVPSPGRSALAALPPLFLLCLYGCGSSTTSVTSPSTVTRCAISAQGLDGPIPAEGGAATISITAARDCTWSAAAEAPWLNIRSGATGQGDGTVEFVAAANPDPVMRRGAIVANERRTEISQAAAACAISLGGSSASFGQSGGTGQVQVRASSGMCAWTAVADADWIVVRSASGQGNGTLSFEVAPASGPPRSGTITVAGQKFSVTQSEGCTYAINPSSYTGTASGGSGTIAVTTTAGCPWTALSNADWITLAPAAGNGPGSVRFTVAATAGPARTGAAVVAGHPFSVVQSPGCTYQVVPLTSSVGATGGTINVSVSADRACAWSATSDTEWITIQGRSSGTGDGTVTLVAAATTGPARSGTATVAGQRVSVTQSPGCSFTIAPESASVDSGGGTGKVAVTAGAACSWSASSNAPWLTIASGAAGTGNGEVQYTVAATTGAGRSGTLTIAGRTFTVTQNQGCSTTLSPAAANVANDGGTGSFSLRVAAGCAWSVASNAPWITIASPASGTGEATVRFSVAANTGAARTGTITAGGQTFTVNQGQACTFTLTPVSATVDDDGGQGTFTVQTAAGCSWTAAPAVSWLTVQPSSGAGETAVRFTAGRNTGPPRSGAITAGGQTFTVNQGQGCTFTLTPVSATVDDDGGQGTFTIQTAAGCSWTAAPAVSWLTVQPSSGTGETAVRFTAGRNTGPPRSGAITAGGQTFTVNQGNGCSYALSASTHAFPASGGTGSVNVAAGNGCSWSATTNASWLSIISGNNGSGNGTVSFSAPAHVGAARTGTLTIGGRTFTVTQAESCTFAIAPDSASLPAEGGNTSVAVTSAGGCTWTASSATAWIRVASGASGSGSGAVQLAAEANPGGPRSGTATIAGRTFTINQASGCSYALNPTSGSVPGTGGTVSVNVTAASGCTWTAASNAPWLSVVSGGNGSGNGAVQIAAQPNTTAARTGTVTVAGQPFTVSQESGCTYAVAPENISSPAAGGSSRIDVTTGAGCTWTSTSNAPWISTPSGSSGTGNGTIELAVSSNSGPARTGTVAVAGRTVTVSQESGCTYSLSASSQNVPAAGGSGNVFVSTSSGCAWSAASNVPWVTVTAGPPGSGGGNLLFAVEANATGAPRSGTLTIAGLTFTVNQE